MLYSKFAGLALLAAVLIGCGTSSTERGSEANSQVTLEENYPGFCQIDGRVDNQHPGYQASGYAFLDAGSNGQIVWKVDVGEAGSYTLGWRYASLAGAASATVSAGGRTTGIAFPSTGAADQWKNASVTVQLAKGINEISIAAAGNAGLPAIDSLTVSGESVKAVNCDGTPVAEYSPNPRCEAGATFIDEVVDCGGARVGLSCEGGEFQPPVINLKNATVKNLRIAADGGSDGIWCTEGDCTLENIIWEDICEDAASQKSTPGSTMKIIGGWAWNNGGGKIVQHNAKETTVIITGGFTAKGQSAKLLRACGNCVDNGGPKQLIIDGVRIEGKLLEEVVGPNVNFGDVATVRNLSVENYTPGNPDICAEWLGYEKSEKKPSKRLGEAWNSDACNVSPSDVTAF